MKKILILIISSSFWITGCDIGTGNSADKEVFRGELVEMERALMSNQSLDQTKAIAMIAKYRSFVDEYPKDTLVAEYLYKAAEISIHIEHFEDAISYYDRILNYHAEFDKRVETLYLKAFVYENHLNQFGRAQEVYQALIEKYPKHKLAQDAQASINNMGMTDEELIKMFQQKNAPVESDSTKAGV